MRVGGALKPLSLVAVVVGLISLLIHGVTYDAHAAQSPLVVRVTTDRAVYRLRRPVRITLTETNTSDHDEPVAIGCQILHGSITHDGATVWTFRDFRLCLTGQGMLQAGASRTFGMFWNGRANPGIELEPGVYVVQAGVDGVTGSATIRLRRRRHPTP
jgi:hypothetical protein